MLNSTTLAPADIIKLVFFSDPGHGWLRVPSSMLFDLGIAEDVSSFSYIDACGWVYLEEDCDFERFHNAMKSKGMKYEFTEQFQNHSAVRSYQPYTFQRCRASMLHGCHEFNLNIHVESETGRGRSEQIAVTCEPNQLITSIVNKANELLPVWLDTLKSVSSVVIEPGSVRLSKTAALHPIACPTLIAKNCA